jgi:hypothetical protein
LRIEEAVIGIERRSSGACLDLAFVFFRAEAREILKLTALFAVPCTAVSFLIARRTDHGLVWAMLLFFAMAPFAGAALVAGVGPRVFGEPLSARRAVTTWLGSLLRLVLPLLFAQLMVFGSAMCFGVPALLAAAFYGFIPEVVLLEELKGSRARQRLSELMRGAFWDLAARRGAILTFSAGVLTSLFLLFDQVCEILLTFPLLAGRVSSVFVFEELWALLVHDPFVVSALHATAWLVYPLARLAWFFCYLDTRIRKEGWDLELAFRVEERRLAEAS